MHPLPFSEVFSIAIAASLLLMQVFAKQASRVGERAFDDGQREVRTRTASLIPNNVSSL
jgi:hypothetical protein